MNRILLEHMLKKMKTHLKEGGDVGGLKIGALYALGNQLEAIFYFLGHELGSSLDEKIEQGTIEQTLVSISEKYHLGVFHTDEAAEDHVTFRLENCPSCKDFAGAPMQNAQGFCSFEAGLYAGIVERITGKHCFAQELECSLQGHEMCKFMIVIPQE